MSGNAPPDAHLGPDPHLGIDGPDLPGCRHDRLEVGGLSLHVAEMGAGPPLLLLHGFPEFWWSWRKVMPALAESFRVIAPDLRGFNLSDKPEGAAAETYDLDSLSGDVVGLLDSLGLHEPVAVLGHDWGGIVAYRLAMRRPERVRGLIQLNAPHPNAWARALLRHPAQRTKGWYVFLTLAPGGVSERLYREQFAAGTVRLARVATPEEVAVYATAFERPGAATAAVNYYRAFMSRIADLACETPARIACPVHVLWGMKDEALEPVLNEIAAEWIDDFTLTQFPDNYHWLAQERPEAVIAAVRETLALWGTPA